MKTINRLVIFAFFLSSILSYAQMQPPGGPGDGAGGSGPGAPTPATPIDMYVYALGIIAIMLITFFTKKYTGKKI